MNAPMSLYRTTIGKKIAMAVSGLILVGFVYVHMAGNLLIFAGPTTYNAYAEALQSKPALVWLVRLVLLAAVVIHVASAIALIRLDRAARPQRYVAAVRTQATTAAAKLMRLGGITLLLFIVYHLLHLTVGVAHGDFIRGDVYHNMVTGLSHPLVAGFYILSMLALGAHLHHGVWSMLQTLGLSSDRLEGPLKKLSLAMGLVIVVGNCSMPIAILAGLIQ